MKMKVLCIINFQGELTVREDSTLEYDTKKVNFNLIIIIYSRYGLLLRIYENISTSPFFLSLTVCRNNLIVMGHLVGSGNKFEGSIR